MKTSARPIALLLAIALTACGTPPPPATDSSAPPEAATQPADTPIAIGTATAVRDDREITVTSSERTDSLTPANEFSQPIEPKGGQLVIVRMSVANTGSESGNMMFSQFKLEDSQGRKFDEISDFNELASFAMWAQEQGLDDTNADIFPGGTFQVAKIFRVAPDAEGLVLVVNNSQFAIE